MQIKNWMIQTATILFDDSKNDLRALPKTVRLQLLTTLSFVWATAFTLYFYGLVRADIWASLVIGHIALIFACYYTFKQFHNIPYVKKPDPNDPPLYDDVWYGS